MKKIFSSKVVLAILSLCILAASIALFAATPEEILGACCKACDKYWSSPGAWLACMTGCLWGATH